MPLDNASWMTLSLSLLNASRIKCECESMNVMNFIRFLKGLQVEKKYFTKKVLLGLTFGFLLAIIVLNVERKLWLPLELEIINSRNSLNKDLINQTPTTKKIALILFDDKTQFLLRQNRVPIKDFERKGRDLIKQAIEKLEENRVQAIGINLNLSNPSGTRSDEALAETISKYKNIVIADSIHSFPSYPLNNILKSASLVGYGELYADYDKVVHKLELADQNTPSFSYALYKTASSAEVTQKLKNKNEFYLRYPKETFSKYSFIDLIEGELKPSDLKDKIVILGIGLKSKLIRDQLLSPVQGDILISDSEVQAVALSNLFSKSYLFKLRLNDFHFSFIFLSMFLGAFFGTIPAIRRLIVAALFFLFVIFSTQVSYTHFNLLLEIVPVIFLILGNLIIGSLVFLQLNLQEQNVKLENSKNALKGKNTQLSLTLSELNERVNELKEVRKQLSSRSEEERKRIARELHDDTLARITDLRRHIESTINSQELSQPIKTQLEDSVQTLNNMTHEVRRIINALRPSMLDNVLGLIPAIENLLDELSKRSGGKIQSKLITKLSKIKLSESNEIHLYRIIQEALNNIYKHSHATKVEVLIEKQPGQVLILVSDNGRGLPRSRDLPRQVSTIKGFGLIDMKERAELIGANVQYLNKPAEAGATVEITVSEEKIENISEAENKSDHLTVTIL